jgi:hypothetical protein
VMLASVTPSTALLLQGVSDDKSSRGASALAEYAESPFPHGKLKLAIWLGGHVFTAEMRGAAYSFLDEHLKSGVDACDCAGV